MQPITWAESFFYALVFCLSAGGGLSRCFLDNEPTDCGAIVRRCVAVGIFGFGLVGIAIGRVAPDSLGSPFPWLAVAAVVGVVVKDLKEVVIQRTILLIQVRVFGDSGAVNTPNEDKGHR